MSKNKYNRNNQFYDNSRHSIDPTEPEVIDGATNDAVCVTKPEDIDTDIVELEINEPIIENTNDFQNTEPTVETINEPEEASAPELAIEIVVETEPPVEPEPEVKPSVEIHSIKTAEVVRSGYQVGTNFESACGNYTNLDDACLHANEQTKTLGEIHHVYDITGKVVFSAKKKLVLLSYKNKKAGVKNANWYT